MDVKFEQIAQCHGKEVMDIFNYYAMNSFAAYPESRLPYEFYGKFLEMAKNYPAYIIKGDENDRIIGFCFLRAYSPFLSFRETAEISSFIDKDYVGKGIGKKALRILEEDAGKLDIKTILASITSENTASLIFHQRNGFSECGRLHRVGKKFGKYFDVVLMQKNISEP